MKFTKIVLCLVVLLAMFTDFASSTNHRRMRRSERNRLKNKFLLNHMKIKKSNLEADTATDPELLNQDVRTMLESKVLVDIQILSIDSAIGTRGNAICTIGYELVLDFASGTPTTPSDLNDGAGGTYMYMCAKYKDYLTMGPNDSPMNTLEIQIDNSNCGDLKGDEMDLNYDAGGKYLYLCRGSRTYDTTTSEGKLQATPIKKLYTYKKSSSISRYDYTVDNDPVKCLKTDLNLGAGGKYIFLCYSRHLKAPKQVDLLNLNIDTNSEAESTKDSAKKNINEFIINNGDGGNDLSMTVSREKTSGTGSSNESSSSMGGEFSVTAKIMAGGYSKSLALNSSINWSTSSVQESTDSSTNSTSMECIAPAGKFFKCAITDETYNFKYSYTATKKFTNFNDEAFSVNVSGTSDFISKTKLTTESCCYFNCDEDDLPCNISGGTGTSTNGMILKSANKPVCDAFKAIAQKKQYTVTNKVYKLSDFGIEDAEVVIDIKWANASKEADISCPQDYLKVGVDIKKGAGGDYVKLCILKKTLSTIPVDKNMINVLRIQYANNNCGTLNLAKNSSDQSDLTNSSNQIYICFGLDIESRNPPLPITNIDVAYTKSAITNSPTSNTMDEWLDSNLGTYNGDSKYIKVTRHKKLPKKVKVENYKNLEFITENSELPSQIDSISAAGSTVTKTISTATSTESSSSSSFNFGLKVGLELEVGAFSSISVGAAFTYNYTSSSSKSKSDETVESQEIPCTALPGKEIKCIITKNTKKISVRYSFNNVFYGYDDKVITTTAMESTTVSSKNDSVSVVTCCVSGCCTGDATKDKDKEQCFDDDKKVRPKDLLCSEYDTCMTSATQAFKAQTATQVTVPASVKKTTRFR